MSTINLIKALILSVGLFLSGAVMADDAPGSVTDSGITSAVQAQLDANPVLKTLHITVATSNGVVTLSGNVKSQDQADVAIALAQSVASVNNVDTKSLTINGTQHVTDDELITAKVKGLFVQAKIFNSKDLGQFPIQVQTSNGVVSLSGTAKNQTEVDTAKTIASSVVGVKDVKTNVQVSG